MNFRKIKFNFKKLEKILVTGNTLININNNYNINLTF